MFASVFFGDFSPISAAILILGLPLNILTNAVLAQSQDSQDVTQGIRMGNLAEPLLGPIVAGALIWVVRQWVAGNRPRNLESLRV